MLTSKMGLAEANLFLNSIIENIPNMIFLKDAKSLTFVKLNKATEELLGIKIKDMIGKSDYDLFPKEQADFFIKNDREVLDGGVLKDIPVEEINSKFGKIYLHTKKIPLMNELNEPIYLLGISENITEKIRYEEKITQLNLDLEKKVRERTRELTIRNQELINQILEKQLIEKNLKAAESRNRLLLESSAEGIYGVDAKGITTFVNNAVIKMTGYNIDELIGQPMHAMLQYKHRDGSKYPSSKNPVYLTYHYGESHRVMDEVMWRKDGTFIPVEYVSSPLYTNESLVGAVVIFTDISERKKTEEQLLNYALSLKQSNQDLDDFAFTVSHDLKEPLRAINHLSQWIEEDSQDKLDDASKKNLRRINQRVAHMSHLIDSILEYSRAGRVYSDVSDVDIKALIQDISETLDPNKHYAIHCVKTLSCFKTEKIQLHQVFSNLIGNSIKHHHHSKGKINIDMHDLGDFYEFSVTDDGPGIAPKNFDKIFQIFQTLDTPTNSHSTGIGLSIVKKIVESRCGGKIWVKSALGQGATFFFTWPKHNAVSGELA